MKTACLTTPARRSLGLLVACATFALAPAQTTPDLTKFADSSVWRIHNRSASTAPDRQQSLRLDARPNDGVAWLVDSNFSEGTIEVDLRGANKPGQSFLGIAFRGESDETYDAVYFRPFNFKNPDIVRRSRSVQYISAPKFPWEKLRTEFPGKYEAAPLPVPDPDDWFHARLVIANRQIKVFVNDATEPSLVVDELSERRGGMIGLWVGNNSSGDFADLKMTRSDGEGPAAKNAGANKPISTPRPTFAALVK